MTAPTASQAAMLAQRDTIETRTSWVVAIAAVVMLALAQGAALIVIVGLPQIAEDLGQGRSLPSAATAFAYFGSGAGGVLCGWLSGRIGMRLVAAMGGIALAAGLALASGGAAWQLLAGIGIGVGVFGTGALFAPMMTHVSMWFDRRRGTALALVSSGQHIAGALWPPVFERAIATVGWQRTMLFYGLFAAALVVPLALAIIRRPPPPLPQGTHGPEPQVGAKVLGMQPNLALALLAIAAFMCCVPMAMPAAHLVAFCADLGISRSVGAAMLSVLLLSAFISRQVWGAISDRIGGLWTVLLGNIAQIIGMAAFLVTTDEAGLFFVAAAYGFGFSGIIPAYILTIRAIFPAAEANWRVPMLIFVSLSGMAFGSWLAGEIFDRVGYYAAAWLVGIAVNLVQLLLVTFLLGRHMAETAKAKTRAGAPAPANGRDAAPASRG